MQISITGLDAINRRFDALINQQDKYVQQGADDAGDELVSDLRRRAPKKTGTLRRSIAQAKLKRGKIGTRIGFKRQGSYAYAVEYGHNIVRGGKVVGRAAPRPFIRPTIDSGKRRIKSAFRKKIIQGIQANTR